MKLEKGQNVMLGDFCRRPAASTGCLGAKGTACFLARRYAE